MKDRTPQAAKRSVLLDPDIPFSRNYFLHVLIGLYVCFAGLMAISPTNRIQWMIENLLPLAAVICLSCTYRLFRFSNLSYLFLFLFLCLHLYGAHYAYRDTHLDRWLKSAFETKRTYFDRAVHLAFGLLLVYPVKEFLTRTARLAGFWSYAIPVVFILSLSASFELGEMGVAMVAGKEGAKYVGLQGDIFDTQKDMLMGLIGGLFTAVVLAWIARGRHKKLGTE